MANYKYEPYECEHKAEDEEDEIVEISDEDEGIQVVDVVGVETSIHRTKNEDPDDVVNNNISHLNIGVDTKQNLVKTEDDNCEEFKDAAAIQHNSAAKDVECKFN